MPAITIRVPQPCHESWAAMTPTGAGRHCAACQQVVVDFTQLTDAELLAQLARAGATSCGRFRADQLGRALGPPAAPSRWRAWLASVLALGGVLGAGRAAAQAGGGYFSAGPTPTVAQPAAPAPAATAPASPAPVAAPAALAPPADGALVVRGRVVSQHDGEGLPGVTVRLQGTTLGCSTTATGDFALTLPAPAATDTLLFEYVGYTRQRVPVAAAPPVVQLQEDVMGLMGEVVVIGGYSARKPWPWHPRRLYQWSKYQLLRPFRR